MAIIIQILKIAARVARKCAAFPLMGLKEIYRTVEDYMEDRRLGIETCIELIPKNTYGKHGDDCQYQPAHYHLLREMIAEVPMGVDDVFVDIGCGKGRAVIMAALSGVKKSIGVDVVPELVQQARENARRLKIKTAAAMEFIALDAADYVPDEATVIFMYDPFGYATFRAVLDRIRESAEAKPRGLRIVYLDHQWGQVLDLEPWLERAAQVAGTRLHVWRSTR